jgi:hypothetical protein
MEAFWHTQSRSGVWRHGGTRNPKSPPRSSRPAVTLRHAKG